VLAGLIVLILRQQFGELICLLAVPLYYVCSQSILHTEYRYVLVIHYFLFVIAAAAIQRIVCVVRDTWGAKDSTV
jgi:hypothetical protein